MIAWVPAVFVLAVLIDYSTSFSQEVNMAHLTNTRGVFFSIVRSVGSVLTSAVGSALLI